MSLPLVNQFLIPFEIWETREPTYAEVQARVSNGWHIAQALGTKVRINHIDTINTPYKAVSYITDFQLSQSIDDYIDKSLNDNNSMYKQARHAMPSATPQVLSQYQRLYGTQTNMADVNAQIIDIGKPLADNQILFHGGGILKNTIISKSFTTTRPLSTSFSPTMAIANGAWRDKFYNENEANLIILTARSMTQNAFVFKINGTDKGHEKEVLIASGATLTIVSKTLLSPNYDVHASGNRSKQVPFYVTHATIS